MIGKLKNSSLQQYRYYQNIFHKLDSSKAFPLPSYKIRY